jgi:hypothetical protein
MKGTAIYIAEDGCCLYPELVARPLNAHSDLTAIGDQDFLKHDVCSAGV